MATLNISLPDQLRQWVKAQVSTGQYSSASDYLCELIRQDSIAHENQLFTNHLQERMEAPDEVFVQSSADDVKARMRAQLGRP